jgi:hypothetical protein
MRYPALRDYCFGGDNPIQTLERAVGEGLSYIMSTYHEVPIEKLLPRLPALIEDCMRCIQDTVIPYFQKVDQLHS